MKEGKEEHATVSTVKKIGKDARRRDNAKRVKKRDGDKDGDVWVKRQG